MQDLLHVEINFEFFFNKINTKSFREIRGGFFGIVGKPQ
jgi:hypothetical protein